MFVTTGGSNAKRGAKFAAAAEPGAGRGAPTGSGACDAWPATTAVSALRSPMPTGTTQVTEVCVCASTGAHGSPPTDTLTLANAGPRFTPCTTTSKPPTVGKQFPTEVRFTMTPSSARAMLVVVSAQLSAERSRRDVPPSSVGAAYAKAAPGAFGSEVWPPAVTTSPSPAPAPSGSARTCWVWSADTDCSCEKAATALAGAPVARDTKRTDGASPKLAPVTTSVTPAPVVGPVCTDSEATEGAK